LTGTARYASVNTHLGFEQSRRDDLESLGFVLMYFNRGRLPWQGIKANTKKEKYNKIAKKKLSTSEDRLCKYSPSEFRIYFKYCRALSFKDEPDYAYLKRMFRRLFFRQKYAMDYRFDWTVQKTVQNMMIRSIRRSQRTMEELISANSKYYSHWRERNHYQNYQQYYLYPSPRCVDVSNLLTYDMNKLHISS